MIHIRPILVTDPERAISREDESLEELSACPIKKVEKLFTLSVQRDSRSTKSIATEAISIIVCNR